VILFVFKCEMHCCSLLVIEQMKTCICIVSYVKLLKSTGTIVDVIISIAYTFDDDGYIVSQTLLFCPSSAEAVPTNAILHETVTALETRNQKSNLSQTQENVISSLLRANRFETSATHELC